MLFKIDYDRKGDNSPSSAELENPKAKPLTQNPVGAPHRGAMIQSEVFVRWMNSNHYCVSTPNLQVLTLRGMKTTFLQKLQSQCRVRNGEKVRKIQSVGGSNRTMHHGHKLKSDVWKTEAKKQRFRRIFQVHAWAPKSTASAQPHTGQITLWSPERLVSVR